MSRTGHSVDPTGHRLSRRVALGCVAASLCWACETGPGDTSAVTEPAVSSPVAAASETTDAKLAEGWRDLFDGRSLAGWRAGSEVDWTVEDGVIRASAGEVGLLYTEEDFENFELRVDFRAAAGTNSGVFVRSPPGCRDPSRECYEINIAPPDNPFPTGSLVGRQRVAGVGESDAWRSYSIVVDGARIVVRLDDEVLVDYSDPEPLPAGPVGLQFNRGLAEFRRVMVRPLSGSASAD